MYLLDCILLQVAKLCRALQTKHLDLSLISGLVDATLNSLDAILLSANWVLQLQDAREELKEATGIEVTNLDICSFQERAGKPFIRLIKDKYLAGFDPPQKMYQPSGRTRGGNTKTNKQTKTFETVVVYIYYPFPKF